MRFRIIGSLIAFGLLQLWLITPISNVQAEEKINLGLGDHFQNSSQDPVEPKPNQCEITVLIRGGGEVNARFGDMQPIVLTDFNNNFAVTCNNTVQLFAVSQEFWQFQGWEGLEEELVTTPSIVVRNGQEVTAVFSRDGLYYETVDVPYVDRSGRLTNQVPYLKSTQRSLAGQGIAATATAEPVINVWYGNTQPFGQIGMSQKYVNILGNVSDLDGDISNLEYSLNGKATVALSIGPDIRRLQDPGDFNVDISEDTLVDGENTLLIRATDSLANKSESIVTIDYDANSVWPLPQDGYLVDWDATGDIQDVAQVVDGRWTVSPLGAITASIGYDRLVAIGDQSWVDYEALIPVKINSIDPKGFAGSNVAPAVGVIMHWTGHIDDSLCGQPKCGFQPTIASWYEWDKDQSGNGQFSMWLRYNQKKKPENNLQLAFDKNYYWKIRAEGSKSPNGQFKMKVWPVGEVEPENWLVTLNGSSDSPKNGSILLLAHYAELVFGDIFISPLNVEPDTTPPVISDVSVAVEPDGATVHWITDEPATSQVNFGKTTTYNKTIEDLSFSTEHFIYLDNLQSEQLYHFKISSTDLKSNAAVTEDDTFTTQKLIAIVSDDFNTCTLDPAWQFDDPLNDANYFLTTTQVDINVPGGMAHDIWEGSEPFIRTPRLMRSVTDPNNLQVKFDSGVHENVTFQGVLFEEDAKNLFRVSYQFEDNQTALYVIGHKEGLPSKVLKKVVINGASPDGPLFIWTNRENGQWKVRYSTNGTNWSDAGTFQFPLSITKAGVFAGNVAGPQTIPALKARVDYWFNANSPIVPEDAKALILPVSIQGNGSVSKNVECGNPVTLTAAPDQGWKFVKWIGPPIDGVTTPVITTSFGNGNQVTALFEVISDGSFTLGTASIGQGSINKNPNKSSYDKGESVTLTAQAAGGWQFDHWEGNLTSSNQIETITMDSNKSITAVFVESEGFDLQIDVIGSGKVIASPEKAIYNPGDSVLLIAFSNPGWAFNRWQGDLIDTSNRVSITITKNTHITAVFEQVQGAVFFAHMPFINR